MALARLTDHLGPATLLQNRGLARFMDSCYPHLAPASWNRVTATLGSFFAVASLLADMLGHPEALLGDYRDRLEEL